MADLLATYQGKNSPQTSAPSSQPLGVGSAYKAINIQNTYHDVGIILDYVNDARKDFAVDQKTSWTESRLTELSESIDEAQRLLTKLEVDNAEYMNKWKNEETGEGEEVLVREVDPKPFDRVAVLYEEITATFGDLLRDHMALLRQHPELLWSPTA